nr:hypothetical protein Iba_chr06bCG0370 [Ipomoea batatas]
MVEGSGRVGFVSPGIPGSPGSPGRDGACKRRRASTVFLVAPLIPESDSAVKKRKANSFGKEHWVLLLWLACRPYRSWFLNAAMVVRLAVNQPPGPSKYPMADYVKLGLGLNGTTGFRIVGPSGLGNAGSSCSGTVGSCGCSGFGNSGTLISWFGTVGISGIGSSGKVVVSRKRRASV